MRKIIFLLLVTFMMFSVAACGDATVDQPITQPETIEPSETPEPNEDVSAPATQEVEVPAPASDTLDNFSEPTFEYSVTWQGREISVGMRLFEVIDLGFEYSRASITEFFAGVDAETAHDIAAEMVEQGSSHSFYIIGDTIENEHRALEIRTFNFTEEPISIMETHIFEIVSVNPQGINMSSGDFYYDGLLLNQNTTLVDVQNRFGEGREIESSIYYDEEGRGRRARLVRFSLDAYGFVSVIIRNFVNPNLSEAVWDGELRLPRIEN